MMNVKLKGRERSVCRVFRDETKGICRTYFKTYLKREIYRILNEIIIKNKCETRL